MFSTDSTQCDGHRARYACINVDVQYRSGFLEFFNFSILHASNVDQKVFRRVGERFATNNSMVAQSNFKCDRVSNAGEHTI